MRKRRNKDESHNNERWVVSYADFVTLLFAFFVVLYATSEQNTEKGKQFEDSVKKYLVKIGAMGSSQKSINTEVNQNSPIEAPLKKYKRSNQKTESVKRKIETYFEAAFEETEIEKFIQDISNEEYGVRVSFRSSEIFRSGTSELKNKSLKNLEKLSKLFKSINYRIFIEGHVFETRDNLKLAANRAVTLTKYFTVEKNIKADRIAAISYGSNRPLFDKNSKNSEMNNRIDFLILATDATYM